MKKPKTIVLDFDDTVVDFMGKLCEQHNRLHGTCISPYDLKEYDMTKLKMKDANKVTVTGEQLFNTFKEYEIQGLYAALKPLPRARHALQRMKEYGYRIIILTARPADFEKQTLFCLLNQDIPYDEVIFSPSKEKANVLKKLAKTHNIQCFVDDKASTCDDVIKTTKIKKVYMVNQEHNRNVQVDPKIRRIPGIFDIIRDLKRIK